MFGNVSFWSQRETDNNNFYNTESGRFVIYVDLTKSNWNDALRTQSDSNYSSGRFSFL